MYVSVKGVRGRGGESLKGELSLSMTLQKRSQHCTAQSPPPTLKLRVNGVCPLFILPSVRSARLAKLCGRADLAWRVIYYRHSEKWPSFGGKQTCDAMQKISSGRGRGMNLRTPSLSCQMAVPVYFVATLAKPNDNK